MNSKTCDTCAPRIMSKPSTPEYEKAWERIFGYQRAIEEGRQLFANLDKLDEILEEANGR